MDLKRKIIELIDSKREGDYWDFKGCWHENTASLLHDIICLANNRTDNDGLLIFGVEDNTYNIVGVERDQNRKNQQNVTDFLRNKSFVGNIRPSIELKTIKYMNHELDILIVKNTTDTPFFITDDHKCKEKCVRKYYIYTRVNDTNTPIDMYADLNHIEYLWKKRFHLTVSPVKRIFNELRDIGNWSNRDSEIGFSRIYHHINNPEFSLALDDFHLSGSFCFLVPTAQYIDRGTIYIKYFNTVIFKCFYTYFDDYITPEPYYTKINLDDIFIDYRYLIKNSNEEILQQFFLKKENDIINDLISIKEKVDKYILYFNDSKEKQSFEKFIIKNKDLVLEDIIIETKGMELSNMQLKNLKNEDEKTIKYIKKELASIIVLKKWQSKQK